MIKFFRNIRKSLIQQNQMGKYFKYAIGEILLVVIGILIALQINNWNEQRKVLFAEKETIKSLKLEFEKNLVDLDSNIGAIEAFINAGNILLEHTNPNYQYGTLNKVDSLISMTIRMAVWDPSLYTLSNIKNSGKLSSLTNNNLKELLIEWESFYTNLLSWYDFYVSGGKKYFEFLEENAIVRNINTNGMGFQFGKSKFEGSNEQLLRKTSFENILTNRVFNNGFILEYYKEAQERLNTIIKECETYEN